MFCDGLFSYTLGDSLSIPGYRLFNCFCLLEKRLSRTIENLHSLEIGRITGFKDITTMRNK